MIAAYVPERTGGPGFTMRYVGRILDWNDQRGFGFVVPNGGGDRAFVHIKALGRGAPRPATGQLISYEPCRDGHGRLNATDIRAVVLRARKSASARPARWRPLIAVVFAAALLIGYLLHRVPSLVLLVYAALSLIAFTQYGMDKSAARNHRWRTPESHLHVVELLGGWPGALLAQELFRHKSKKASFQSAFWTMACANCAALAWLLASGRAASWQSVLGSLAGG